jgi:hypothetical protein
LGKSTTIRELSTKVYQKSQPVDIKLMGHYVAILKILSDGKKSVNEIFSILRKQTKRIPYQSDKSSTILAIENLLKYQLVTATNVQRGKAKRKYGRRKKSKAQKIDIEPTPIGKELSQLIYYIHEYSNRYKKLKDIIDYHFNILMIL